MITVKELFQIADRHELCIEYLKLKKDVPEEQYSVLEGIVSMFLDTLLNINARPNTSNIVLYHLDYERYDGEPFPSAAVFDRKEIRDYFRSVQVYDKYDNRVFESLSVDDVDEIYNTFRTIMEKHSQESEDENLSSCIGRVNGYDFMFSDWSEILGYLIPDHIAYSGDAITCAASVLHIMTFFGFDEKDKLKEIKKLNESIEEADRIKQLPKEEQKHYFKTLEEVFGEIGYKDDRSEEEKTEDEKKRKRNIVLTELSLYRVVKHTYRDLFVRDVEVKITVNGNMYENFRQRCDAMNISPEAMLKAYLAFCADPKNWKIVRRPFSKCSKRDIRKK